MIKGFKLCYCHTCKKYYQSLGIMRHRAMHRDKREDCEITYSHGDTYIHHFSKRFLDVDKNNGVEKQ